MTTTRQTPTRRALSRGRRLLPAAVAAVIVASAAPAAAATTQTYEAPFGRHSKVSTCDGASRCAVLADKATGEVSFDLALPSSIGGTTIDAGTRIGQFFRLDRSATRLTVTATVDVGPVHRVADPGASARATLYLAGWGSGSVLTRRPLTDTAGEEAGRYVLQVDVEPGPDGRIAPQDFTFEVILSGAVSNRLAAGLASGEVRAEAIVRSITLEVDGRVPRAPHYAYAQQTKPGNHPAVTVWWPQPWDIGDAPLEGYRVYRGAGSCTGMTSIATTSETSFVDTSVERGKEYCYQVSAVNGFGESALSRCWVLLVE